MMITLNPRRLHAEKGRQPASWPAVPAALRLTNIRTGTKFVYFRPTPVYRREFLMFRSIRSGGMLLALMTAVATVSLHAQANMQAHPFFITQGAGQKGIVGFTPAQ